MGEAMRRLLTFECDGTLLGATLDGDGATGILMVTGGSQTRIGSHRMYERLARSLSKNGYSVFRFDRRGVGDSEGQDPGFRGSAADIEAAAAAFRAENAALDHMIGFGLCDGATALALFGRAAGLEGLILVNPWLVEAKAGAPPPAAIKRHYRKQLRSREAWRKLLSGSISYRKLLAGLVKLASPSPATLSDEVARALSDAPPTSLLLAREDATAVAAEVEWQSARFAGVRSEPIYVETDSHTFARRGDAEALLAGCLTALGRLTRPISPRSSRA